MSSNGVPETRAALEAMKSKYAEAVRTTLKRLTMLLVARVKENKLSGQVLNVRTGRLRRSINDKIVDESGVIAGYVGTNVVYARPHEMGFTGDEQVRAHMRQIKMAWGKMLKNPVAVQVAAHTRHVSIPERSFLRSALAEMQPQVQAELAKAMENARAQ